MQAGWNTRFYDGPEPGDNGLLIRLHQEDAGEQPKRQED